MKTLSLKKPFAELVISGRKTIEIRKWKTNFRDKFFIHSPKTLDKISMKRFGFGELLLGKILGEAVLIDVKGYNSNKEHDLGKKKYLISSSLGGSGFILNDAKRIDGPTFSCKLNFWNFEGGVK